jgi:hypothetical protein
LWRTLFRSLCLNSTSSPYAARVRKLWVVLVCAAVGIALVSVGSWTALGGSSAETDSTVHVPGVASDHTAAASHTAAAAVSNSDPGWCSPVHPVTTTGADGHSYTATFNGAPPAPLSACGESGFDVQIHSRDSNTWYQLQPMEAEHGPDCAGPPATHHESGSYAEAVFECKDHLMTSINAEGYGEIMLTPDQMVDFSNGGVVSFDVSTERQSTRDWWDLWITPWKDNLTLPFDTGEVDLQGPPKNGLNVSIGDEQASPVATIFRNGATEAVNAAETAPSIQDGIAPGTNQAASRQTFKLTLTRTHIRFERLQSSTATAIVFIDQDVPDVGFSQGVVQFGQHSYNPTKDGAGVPATWHWNNFSISPAVPFSMSPLPFRYMDKAGTLTTTAGMLRFGAICKVKLDGQLLTPQVPTVHNDHFNSYFVPVTAGAHTLEFADDDWYTQDKGCFAAGFNVWSSPG